MYTPFHEEGDISGGEKFAQAIGNAFIMIGVILVMTVLLVLLYKYKFYKVCYAFYSFLLLTEVLQCLYYALNQLFLTEIRYKMCVHGVLPP